MDAPYFHVVFTLPAQLNALIYANQKLLYDLLHRCSGETLLELSSNPKYLGANPGIVQILHTWGQSLNFHPHIHCVISGAGLTKDLHLKLGRKNFFLPQKAMARKFRQFDMRYSDKIIKSGSVKRRIGMAERKKVVDFPGRKRIMKVVPAQIIHLQNIGAILKFSNC